MTRILPFLLLFICVFFTTYVSAQPELDTTFATTGKLIVNGYQGSSVSDTAVQPDNKIILVGRCFFPAFLTYPLCINRLNENGSFDSTYRQIGSNETVPGSTAAAQKSLNGVALQNDGKIVTVGYSIFSPNKAKVVMIRFNADGNYDSSFSDDGFVITEFDSDAYGLRVVIQPDQKIVVVGYITASSSNYKQFVARYLPDGTLDGTFGNGGIFMMNMPEVSAGHSIALQADGKIVTGGSTIINGSASYLMTRLNRDGSIDTSFGENGYKNFGANTSLLSGLKVAIQSDGRILGLGGNTLYRFNMDGSLDTSFNGSGMRPALNINNSSTTKVSVSPSGKITVVGFPPLNNTFPVDYLIARYLPNGSPDISFNLSGYLSVDFGVGDDGATAIAFDTKGRTVVAGLTGQAFVNQYFANSQFSVLRLIAPLAQNVGFTGRIVFPDGTPVRNALITLKRDAEIIGYSRTNPFGYFRFQNIQSAQTYTITVKAKNADFYDRSVLVDGEISNYLIVGEKHYF